MPTTTNYGWTTPADTDLVKDGAAAIRTLGSSIDSTLKTQIDAQIPDSLLTTKGDIIGATGASTPARLAVGANDTVLTADSTTATGLKWATPASGGMTLISTTSLTGASVTVSSIPQTYSSLYVVFRNFLPATNSAYLRMYFNGVTGTSYRDVQNLVANATAFNQAAFSIGPSLVERNTTSQSLATVQIPDYTNATTWKWAANTIICTNDTTVTNFEFQASWGVSNITNAITSISVNPNTGNFTSGSMLLYGVK